MQREMKVWQWLGGTAIAAISMVLTVLAFADGFLNRQVDMKLSTPLSLIDKLEDRLDRIENKVDELLRRKQ